MFRRAKIRYDGSQRTTEQGLQPTPQRGLQRPHYFYNLSHCALDVYALLKRIKKYSMIYEFLAKKRWTIPLKKGASCTHFLTINSLIRSLSWFCLQKSSLIFFQSKNATISENKLRFYTEYLVKILAPSDENKKAQL